MKHSQIFIYISVNKGLANNDGERARGSVFQEIRPGSHFKIGDFVNNEIWGRYRRTTHIARRKKDASHFEGFY